jgi:hypothetical protein
MNKVAVGVVTTAARSQYLQRTLDSLNDPSVIVYKDLVPGLWGNHVAAWRELFKISDRALLLHDDMEAPKNWRQTVELFARRFQAPLISFFSPSKAVKEAADKHMAFASVTGNIGVWDQALMMPRRFYEDFHMWLSSHPEIKEKNTSDRLTKFQGFKHYNHDDCLCEYIDYLDSRIILSAPSLFQHIGEESGIGIHWKVGGRTREAPTYHSADWDSFEYFSGVL